MSPSSDAAPAAAPFAGPLFLVGMPRSGTKLLRDLLNQHPDIGIPEAETEFLPALARAWPAMGDLREPAAWAAFVDHMRGSAYFVYLAEERGIVLDGAAWRAACPSFALTGVFEGLCRLHGGAGPGQIWGDKSPGHIAHLGLLRALWPEARVVHIVRDVRDHALSMQKAWGKDPLRAAVRWHDRVGAALGELAAWGPAALTLRYEDLVADPAAALARVCGLVGRDFVPEMTTLARPAENLGDTAGQTAVVADNVAKWRHTMDPALARRIGALAAPVLTVLGYPAAPGPVERPGTTELRLRQLADGARLVRFDVDQRGILGALRFRWRIFRETGGVDR